MSIQKSYVRSVARQLQRHAVWEPGAPIGLGDYGVVDGGTFRRLGNVTSLLSAEVKRKAAPPGVFEFSSEGVASARADAHAPSMKSALEVAFEHKDSLYLRAAGSQIELVENLQELADQAVLSEVWESEWRVVTSLRSAASFVVLFNSTPKSSISIAAAPAILDGLEVGEVTAEAALSFSGDVGYRAVGQRGALLMELVRIVKNPLFGGVLRFSANQNDRPGAWEKAPTPSEIGEIT